MMVKAAMKRTEPNPPETRRRFAAVAGGFAKNAQVTMGGPKGFGSGALRVNGKIFAMVSSGGDFVVKLPEGRAREITSRGEGRPFEPRPGRQMKEWVVITSREADWAALAREAYRFVMSTKGR